MPARHFLCCLPLRLGALLISFFQLVFGGLIAAATWYTYSGMRTSCTSPFSFVGLDSGPCSEQVAITQPRSNGRSSPMVYITPSSHSQLSLGRCCHTSPTLEPRDFNTLIYRLIGTLGRKARLLATYSFYLSWSVGVQIILSALYLWAFFSTSRETLIERCIDGSTDKEVQDICNNSFNAGKWAVIAGIVIGLLIQICESPPSL